MHNRVLFLGPTGVDKATAAARLRALTKQRFDMDFRYIDFENDFLKKRIGQTGSKSWTTFLAQDIPVQTAAWKAAWTDFSSVLSGDPIVLGLHATYVSTLLGLRSPIDIHSICDVFRPSLIVTLVDDVYSMWQRTETRAGGAEFKGRPRLADLISSRRAEQLLGDMILSHTKAESARHVLFATGNSLTSLANLLLFDASVTYLSFPISAPRRLQEKGDDSFVTLINEAHRKALSESRQQPRRAFVTPLAIDELPLLGKAQKAQTGPVSFQADVDRWPTEDLWGADEAVVPSPAGSASIPREQLDEASGTIRTDVGWRDRRLVQQANALAIVCPKPPGEDRITRGVHDEIQTAAALGTVCFLWQKPEWDSKDFVSSVFPLPGSMGISQVQSLVNRAPTLDDLIRSAP